MEASEIIKNAKWNKNTIYQDQIEYIGSDGRIVSVIRSKEGMTRQEAEEILVERVQELYN